MIKINKYHSYYYLDFMYVVAAVCCSPWIARERSFTPVSPGRHNHQQFVAMRVRLSV